MPSSNQNDITTSATKDSQQSHRPLLQTIIQNMTSTGRTSKQTEEYAVGTRPASLEPSADDRRKPNLSFKIVWHNLSYRVDTKKWYTRAKARLFRQQERMTNISEGTTSDTCKIILNNLCGSIMSGQLTAIMGPSGSGKTSLLNCLFQNQTRGVTGSIIVDGARQSKKLKLCFIPQKDYLVEYLTVREDLVFVSKLRNTHIGAFNNQTVQRKTSKTSQDKAGPSSCLIETNEGDECEDETTINKSNKKNNNKDLVRQNKRNSTSNNHVIDHQENALRIAKLLGLTSCLDVKIGKISGGQQKRLSIAREIMSNPDVLILDEPTTGLDSLSCLKTIRVLKDLAVRPKLDARPMAIVVVIHQPQREVFELFDKVYFISKGGNVIFDEKPQMAENIIENVGHVQMPNANYNPASFLMEIASSEMGEEPINHLNAYQSRKFHSDYDINKLKQLKKQPNRNYAISNWRLCASDDRKFSDIDLVNSDDITLDTKTINNKRESNLIISIHDNEEEYGNNNEQKAEEQEKFIKNSGSNNTNYLADLIDRSTNNDSQQDDNNSTTSSKNSYFISHQLRNCLRSHSTNSVQSFRHVFILTHRSWLSVIRNPSFSTTRLAFHLILPLTMVFIFGSDMGSSNACPMAESELDILDISDKINDKLIERQQEQAKLALENLCFFIVLLYGFSINIISITATHYPLTLRMFKKETMNGLYTSGPYLIAQSLGELPLEMFFPTISVLLAYPLTGQLSSYLEWRMIVTSIIVTLVIYTNHSLGHLCGSIFVSNINVAVIVAQATTLPMILLSGFVVRISRMSYWLRKLSIISPYKLGLDGIMVARYGFEVCQCNTSTFVDSKSVKIARVTTQMRHVMQYLLDRSFEQNSLRDSESIENNFVDSDLSKESNNRTMRINSTIDLHQLNSTYTTSQHSKNMALSYHPTNSDNFIDRMGQNLLKAQTYGLEMSSCQDVKPYPLHIYNLFDSDLFISALGLIVMIVIIKMATFSIVKSYLYFNKA